MSRLESANLKHIESMWAKATHDKALTSLVNSYEKYVRQITGNQEYVFTTEQRETLKVNLQKLAENVE